MNRIAGRILLASVVVFLLLTLWWFRSGETPATRSFPPVYAFDPTAKTWFTVPGNTAWPCLTPAGRMEGLEMVMAKAPDGTLTPVLLSRTETVGGGEVRVEGAVQETSGRMRRMICEPATMSWIDEDSKAAAQLYARIKALAAKGYVLDVRPAP